MKRKTRSDQPTAVALLTTTGTGTSGAHTASASYVMPGPLPYYPSYTMPYTPPPFYPTTWPSTLPQIHTGHILGDPEVVAHCFAGEVKYLTPEGWVTFEDTVGTEQMVLSRVDRNPVWVPAHIHPFGEQPIWEVHLRRNQRTKVIRTTDGHRWLTRSKGGRTEKYRDQPLIKRTDELEPGHRLDWCLPVTRIGQSAPSPIGIMHGFTYGDGSRAQRGSKVTLWGEKDTQLLGYFHGHRMVMAKTPNNVDGTTVSGLPGFFKDRPSLSEATHYLYGFLAGWFAADGSVDAAGQVELCSARYDDLVFAQQVGLALGISTYDIVSKMRGGFGQEREIHTLVFIGSTLRPEFFLINEHRDRYIKKQERSNSERIGWTVEKVVQTDAIEPVFCAVVPGIETFTIEGFIHTGNCPFCGSGDIVAGADQTISCSFCNRSFLVMEQPQYNSMPGQPGATTDATMPESATPPAPEEGIPGADPSASEPPGPATDTPSAPQHAPVNPQTDPETLKKAPPFSFKSSRQDGSIFRTASGHQVDEDDFVKHVAFRVDRDFLVRR